MGLFKRHKYTKTRPEKLAWTKFQPHVEQLETRLVPYAVSGNVWPNPNLISISFVPDGTIVGSNANGYITSNLFSAFNGKFGSPAAWQSQILRAAQIWAQQTNINFTVVPDNGSPIGSGNYEQGDPNMGDIRIGGYNFGSNVLAQTYLPPPADNYSIAGDMQFNTNASFNIGKTYDLGTVATHEFGHALGLYHSKVVSAVMYANYSGIKSVLNSDDITSVRSVYSNGQPRANDSYYNASPNSSFATATDITSSIDPTSLTGTVDNASISANGQNEYFTVTVPANTDGTLQVSMQAAGLSLLDPNLTVYAPDQVTVLGQGSAASGGTVSLSIGNLAAGEQIYLKASSDSTPFGEGAYGLALSFTASSALPAIAVPNTAVLNGAVPSTAGGQPTGSSVQYLVGGGVVPTTQVSTNSNQTVAMDANGNYVVVWAQNDNSLLGTGWDIYAQRYAADGTPQGFAFEVNTTTSGDQTEPSVAMDPAGDFVVSWTSNGQDGSGLGVYAQRFNASGTKQGGEFRVNTTTLGDQDKSMPAMDQSGNVAITWESNGQDGSGWGVYVQRYNSSGTPLGGEILVNQYTYGDQRFPRMAMKLDGSFIVTWSSYGEDGSGWGVYADQFDASGNSLTGEFRANSTISGDQVYSYAAVNTQGSFVITWKSYGQDGSGWGVYGQLYNQSAIPVGGEFQVNTTIAGDQTADRVAMAPDGSFIVTWSSNGQDSLGWEVMAQQFDASGNKTGGEFMVNTTTLGNQQNSSIAMDMYGHAVVVWWGPNALGVPTVYGQNYLLKDGTSASFEIADGFDPSAVGSDPADYASDASVASTADTSDAELSVALETSAAAVLSLSIGDNAFTNSDGSSLASVDTNNPWNWQNALDGIAVSPTDFAPYSEANLATSGVGTGLDPADAGFSDPLAMSYTLA